MALLGKIRSQFGWVMIGLVILGVGGFLLMDVSSVGRGGMTGQIRLVGSVGGMDISRTEFDSYMEDYQRSGMSSEEIRNYVWDELVADRIFAIQTKKIGAQLCDKEIEDLFIGENISPIILMQFQQSGSEVDRAAIEQQRNTYKSLVERNINELNPQEREFVKNWGLLEKKIIGEHTSSKYINMVRKGVYSPGWLTAKEFARANRSYEINYVRILYSDIPNSEVQVSDAELTAYIKENAKAYEREANVSIEYVMFPITPSTADSASYMEKMAQLANDWKTQEDDTAFIERNGGRIDPKFYTSNDWLDPEEVKEALFAMEEKDVYGPYYDGMGNVKVSKIVGTKILPDSVECRHLFKRANPRDINNLQQNAMLLDSLRKGLQSGEFDFATLAAEHNDDASREKGGDLGWRKKGDPYGEEFEEKIFYTAEKDSLVFFQTREGLHLLQVRNFSTKSNTMGYRIASVLEPIYPKIKTENEVLAKATEFVSNYRKLEQFQNAVKENPELRLASKAALQLTDFEISPQIKGSVAAEIIRWAHNDAQLGDVAGKAYPLSDPSNNYTAYYVVPALVSKTPKGLASIADINLKTEVEQIVRNRKKADMVRKNLEGVNSLDAVVQKYSGVKIESAAVQYNAPFIPEVQAVEPKIAGMAESLEPGKIGAPIQGNQGVYVIQLINKREGPTLSTDPKLLNIQRQGVISRLAGDAASFKDNLVAALKEKLTVKDNRSKIY